MGVSLVSNELSDDVLSTGDAPTENCQTRLSPEQSRLLSKYENYLLSIACHEMRYRFHRKFGPSDVVQQTYCRAVDRIGDFRGQSEEEFRGWLRKILLSQLRQNERDLQRQKRNMRLERPIAWKDQSGLHLMRTEPTDHWPTPCTDAATLESDNALHAAIGKLPTDYQQVIRLRNWDRLPFEQIATAMERSESAVQKLWYRAIVKLQQQLGDSDG